MKMRHKMGLAIVMALALIASACGGGSSGSPSAADVASPTTSATTAANVPATTAPQTTTAPPSTAAPLVRSGGIEGCAAGNGAPAAGEPVLVGAILSTTGPENFGESAVGAAALFDCVNANGGINGRPISYITIDDEWTASLAAQGARSLIDQGVVAMVGGSSFVDCSTNRNYYAEQSFPVIVAQGIEQKCFEAPTMATVNHGPRLGAVAVAEQAVADGATTVTCLGNLIPNVGRWACDGVAAWGAAAGIEVTIDTKSPPLASGVANTISRALGYGNDAVVVIQPASVIEAYLSNAEATSAGVPWYTTAVGYDSAVADSLAGDWAGGLTTVAENGGLSSDSPDAELWQLVMADHATADSNLDIFTQAGFLAAKIFVDTMMELDPETIDRAATADALFSISGYESDMLCAPWYFGVADRHNANHYSRTVRLGAEGWETAGGCQDVHDPALSDILAGE